MNKISTLLAGALLLGSMPLFAPKAHGATLDADLWIADPMLRVFETDRKPSVNVTDDLGHVVLGGGDIYVYGARNEYVPAQIALTPSQTLTNVTVAPGNLTNGANVIPGSAIEARFVEPHFNPGGGTSDSTSYYTDAARVPEVLSDETSATMPAGRSRAIYLNVHVPAAAAAGDYSGTVTVQSDQGSGTVALNVHVWNFALEGTLAASKGKGYDLWLQHGGDMYANNPIADYWDIAPGTEQWWSLMTDTWNMMAEHGQKIFTTNLFSEHALSKGPPLVKTLRKGRDGAFSFDWTDLDRYYQILLAKVPDAEIHLHSLFNYADIWKAAAMTADFNVYDANDPDTLLYVQRGYMTANDHFNSRGLLPGQYWQWFDAFLPALESHLSQKGWLDQTYFSIKDEYYGDFYTFFTNEVRKAAPGLKIADAVYTDATYGISQAYVGMPPSTRDMSLTSYKPEPDFNQSPNALAAYSAGYNDTSWLQSSLLHHRLLWSDLLAQRYDQYLRWDLAAWRTYTATIDNPNTGSWATDLAGGYPEGWFVYASALNDPKVLPGLRYEMYRQGSQDLEYLMKGYDRGAPVASYFAQVAGLESSTAQINRQMYANGISNEAQDVKTFNKARRELGAYLETHGTTSEPGLFHLKYPYKDWTDVSRRPLFNWMPSNGATGYTLTVSTRSDLASPTLNVNVGSATSYRPTVDLAANTKYYYRVTAANAAGSKAALETYAFTTGGQTIPGTTTLGAAGAVTSATAALSWTAATGTLDGYRIRLGTSAGHYESDLDVAGTSIVLEGLRPNTTYYAVVAPFHHKYGEAADSNEISFTTTNAPRAYAPAAANGGFVVQWAEVAGATGYKVKIGTASGSYTTVNTVGAVTRRTVTGLTNGVPYYVVVSAVVGGVETANSAEFKVVPTSNLALNKSVWASSEYGRDAATTAKKAVDGDAATWWSSDYADDQYIVVDLGDYYALSGVKLMWGGAYAQTFSVQTSTDDKMLQGLTWQDQYRTTSGAGGTQTISLASAPVARYVRVYSEKRATAWGNSLLELEVTGTPATFAPPVPEHPMENDIALHRTVVASSTYNGNSAYEPENAVDQNGGYWSSDYADNQWIYVDLGESKAISEVRLDWTLAYASGYKIQTSNDAATWTDRYSTASGDGGLDVVTFGSSVNARYVRLYCTQRATAWGNAIYRLSVYDEAPIVVRKTNAALNKTAAASSSYQNNPAYAPGNAVDGDPATYWSSDYSDNQWLQIDLGAPVNIQDLVIRWGTPYASYYRVLVSGDGTNWVETSRVVNGTGGVQTMSYGGLSARYVRIECLKRATAWGNVIYEVEVNKLTY